MIFNNKSNKTQIPPAIITVFELYWNTWTYFCKSPGKYQVCRRDRVVHRGGKAVFFLLYMGDFCIPPLASSDLYN